MLLLFVLRLGLLLGIITSLTVFDVIIIVTIIIIVILTILGVIIMFSSYWYPYYYYRYYHVHCHYHYHHCYIESFHIFNIFDVRPIRVHPLGNMLRMLKICELGAPSMTPRSNGIPTEAGSHLDLPWAPEDRSNKMPTRCNRVPIKAAGSGFVARPPSTNPPARWLPA